MIKKIILCFLICASVWFGGLVWFVTQTPNTTNDLPTADAIVVLTGDKGRLEQGLRLLISGKGRRLFVSGVFSSVHFEELMRTVPTDVQQELTKLLPGSITLGRQAENTIGNAQETARWVEKYQLASLLIVTSDYHMQRSLSEFREVMPNITLIPAPVFSERNDNLRLLLSEYHKYLASKLRHWLIFFLPGERP